MPAFTSGYVKNIIRRCFSEIADPPPKKEEIRALWRYFKNRCAYCDKLLSRARKEGHIDHLSAASSHGFNSLGNRVLACAQCNAVEKLDKDWEEFLSGKALPEDLELRRKRIRDWQATHARPVDPDKQQLLKFARAQAEEVVELLERNLSALRQPMLEKPCEEDTFMIPCALRFDGYRYIEEKSVDIAALIEKVRNEGINGMSDEQRWCVFFSLQRHLHKGGGEMLSRHSPDWKIFRDLFFALCGKEVPDFYGDERYSKDWERKTKAEFSGVKKFLRYKHKMTTYLEENTLHESFWNEKAEG